MDKEAGANLANKIKDAGESSVYEGETALLFQIRRDVGHDAHDVDVRNERGGQIAKGTKHGRRSYD